jgi:DNA-binding transcriptional ArsR family regulator
MTLSPYALRFLAVSRAGAAGDWKMLLHELEAELRQRRGYNLSPDALEWAELKTLRDLTDRLAQFRSSDIPAILAARDNATQILKLLVENESRGQSRMTYNDLQTALEMKKANLSMQLGYLEENEILRRQRQGRTTWIELSPSARKFAIEQGWLEAQEILTSEQRTFTNSKLREPLTNPSARWSNSPNK